MGSPRSIAALSHPLNGSSDFVMQKNINLTPMPIFKIQNRNPVKLAGLDIERSIGVE
jgi:hypothetical protein